MMERESNSRTRRTKAALRASLAALIQEKGLAGVTVRELAARAGVNRATFYIHYHDIADLLNQTHREILSDLFAVLEAHREEENAERPPSPSCATYSVFCKSTAPSAPHFWASAAIRLLLNRSRRRFGKNASATGSISVLTIRTTAAPLIFPLTWCPAVWGFSSNGSKTA